MNSFASSRPTISAMRRKERANHESRSHDLERLSRSGNNICGKLHQHLHLLVWIGSSHAVWLILVL